jgi:predicted alpha/beta hydrolase
MLLTVSRLFEQIILDMRGEGENRRYTKSEQSKLSELASKSLAGVRKVAKTTENPVYVVGTPGVPNSSVHS